MILYFVVLIISLLLIQLSKIKAFNKSSKFIKAMSVIPWILISAIRYNVGTDFLDRYVVSYNIILRGNDVPSLETFFKLLIKLCTLITDNYQILFVITSFFIYTVIFKFIINKSDSIELSIIIFFLGGFFFQSLNIVRQFVAMAFILIGYDLLLEGKKLKYFMCCCIAILFHNASIVAITLMFLNRKKEINIGIVLLSSLSIFIFNDLVEYLVEYIVSFTRFEGYLGSKFDVEDLSIPNYLRQLFIYIFMYYMYITNKKQIIESDESQIKEIVFLLNIQAVALCFYSLSSSMLLFSRLYLYFSIFQIISIPKFINLSKNKFNKKIYIIIAIIIYSVFFINNNIFKNDNDVLPYYTCFNKDIYNIKI